jgi:hypothetical protein
MKLLDYILIIVLSVSLSYGLNFLEEKLNKKTIAVVDMMSLIQEKTENMKQPNPEALKLFSRALELKLQKYAQQYDKDIFVKQSLATDKNVQDLTNDIREELKADGLYE